MSFTHIVTCSRQKIERFCTSQRDDVRLLERGDNPDLALEAIGVDVAGQLGGEHLDDHLPSEPDFFGHEVAGHPAAAELAADHIARSQSGLELIAQKHEAGRQRRGASNVWRLGGGRHGVAQAGRYEGLRRHTKLSVGETVTSVRVSTCQLAGWRACPADSRITHRTLRRIYWSPHDCPVVRCRASGPKPDGRSNIPVVV